MKIEHNIAQLLYRHQCVTVPGFGAFLTETQSAQVNLDSNSFYPPKKVVLFNAYLKNNDGLLANHISQTHKESYENSVEAIEKEVTSWKVALQNNESIDLKNIGKLFKNQEGNLVFESSNQVNYLTHSFGLSSYVSPVIKREILKNNSEITEEELHKTIDLIEYRKRPNYLKYAAIFVLGLGTIGGVGFKMYNDNVITETKIVQLEVQKDIQNKIQEATFFIQTPLPDVTLSVKHAKLAYHIVAGSFRNEKNAERITDRLIKKGFEAKKIKKNNFGLYPVIYGSYYNFNDAQKAMIEIRKKENPEAWLLIKDLE